MDFISYLLIRHHTHGGRRMGETSAKQYNNRMENMVKYGIYNEEVSVTQEITEKIKKQYVNARGEYQLTIKYYLEYKSYLSSIKIS